MPNLKKSLLDYINHITIYDYAAFGWLGFLIFIMLFLAILLRKKNTLSISLLMFAMLLMFIAPIPLKLFLDQTIRKIEIKTISVDEMEYAKALVIVGELKNSSKIDFSICSIQAKVVRFDQNKYKNIIYSLKPLLKKTIYKEETILKEQIVPFKVIFKRFHYEKDYNVTLSATCY